jgi:hypothetical protein
MFHKIDIARAVWSGATLRTTPGGEARVAEPPASRQKMFHKIDIAKAVWSGAT